MSQRNKRLMKPGKVGLCSACYNEPTKQGPFVILAAISRLASFHLNVKNIFKTMSNGNFFVKIGGKSKFWRQINSEKNKNGPHKKLAYSEEAAKLLRL